MKETLIVSYSYSGHTHRIAQALCALTGGDWREIYPWQPYPMAFPELLDQVQKEVQTGYRPRLLPGAGNPRSYAVTFVGSPNWCGSIAPPLAAWLRQHGGLAGKTVLPFYSHCGGEPGDIAGAVRSLCPKAQVAPAFAACPDEDDLAAKLDAWLTACGVLSAISV